MADKTTDFFDEGYEKETLPEFVRRVHDEKLWRSPDISELRQAEFVPVFIYGTEQFRFSEHARMSWFPRYGVGRTVSSNYTMFIHNTEHYPIVFFNADHYARGAIQGELYLVTPDFLVNTLDLIFMNNVFFKRVERTIRYHPPGNTENSHVAGAYIYLAKPEAWKDKLRYLERLTLFAPNKKELPVYYQFTYLDDQPNRKNQKPPF